MKKTIVTTVIAASLLVTSTAAYAALDTDGNTKNGLLAKPFLASYKAAAASSDKVDISKKSPEEIKNNMINKFVSSTDARVNKGEITREQADKLIEEFKSKIDSKGFVSLDTETLKSMGLNKKLVNPDKLKNMVVMPGSKKGKVQEYIKNFTARVNERVQSGELTREQGDNLIAKVKRASDKLKDV